MAMKSRSGYGLGCRALFLSKYTFLLNHMFFYNYNAYNHIQAQI